jgi:putative polynucleotide kinase|nr:MAG TPA: polynucleotide kinase [Caudoviricetes sp.]DAT40487.1 MAG TPA: polynucleotide kinase [Caudoviricetes sp.]
MKPVIILVRGIQGSGKTTLAKNLVKYDNKLVRINRDDIRAMLCTEWSYAFESIVIKMQLSMVKAALDKGYSVVIDDVSNLNEKTINRLKQTFPNTEIQLKDICLLTDVNECIRRDALRENPIGEKVIRETYNRYIDVIEHYTSMNK